MTKSPSEAHLTSNNPDPSFGEERLLQTIGEIGPWQLKQCLLLSLVAFAGAWHILVINFQAAPLHFQCIREDQQSHRGNSADSDITVLPTASSKTEQCFLIDNSVSNVNSTDTGTGKVPCTHWVYQIDKPSSNIISEWNLVCDHEWLQKMAEGVFMLGVLFGVLGWGWASDRYGRRPVLISCVLLTFTFSAVNVASQSIRMFLTLRFLTAFCDIGSYMTAYTICMEMIGRKWRSILGAFFVVPASLGFITIGGIAYFIRDWRSLQMIVTLPSLSLTVYYWYIPESLRWLIVKHRDAEVYSRIEAICRYNRLQPPESLGQGNKEAAVTCRTAKVPEISGSNLGGVSCYSVGWRLYLHLIVLLLCWACVGAVFYGILLNTTSFGSNIYLNAMVAGALDLPASALSVCGLMFIGRKVSLMASLMASGTSCLVTLLFQKGIYQYDWPILATAMTGKFCISVAFGVVYVYSSEVFPTAVRSRGLALCSMVARVGSVAAPFLFLLSDFTAILVFGLLGVVSGLLVMVLPETSSSNAKHVIYAENTHWNDESVESEEDTSIETTTTGSK